MMNWLGRLLGGAPPQQSAPRAATQSAGGGVIITDSKQLSDFLRGAHNEAGAVVNENSAMCVGVAYRCTSILAGTTAGLPLDLYRRIDEKRRAPAKDLKLRSVLTVRPNQWQTPFDFRRMMTANVVIHGQAAALKVPSLKYGLELVPLPGGSVTAKLNDRGQLTYEQVTSRGRSVYRPDEIFFLRGFSLDGLNGMGVLQLARKSLGNAIQGEEANAGIFKRGRIGSGAIKTPNVLSQAAYDRLSATVNENYAGAANAHRIMILEEGLDWASVGFKADDLQFMESRAFTAADIGKFFGVPPHMYGDSEKSTSWGTGIEQQTLGFIKFTLMDYIKMWNQSIARDFLTDDERETIYARHDLKDLLTGDSAARSAFYSAMRGMRAMSANEVRALEELEPYDGGDVFDNPAIDVTKEHPNEPAKTA